MANIYEGEFPVKDTGEDGFAASLRWGNTPPMPTGSMTWLAMFGNGAWTGTDRIITINWRDQAGWRAIRVRRQFRSQRTRGSEAGATGDPFFAIEQYRTRYGVREPRERGNPPPEATMWGSGASCRRSGWEINLLDLGFSQDGSEKHAVFHSTHWFRRQGGGAGYSCG